MSEDKERVAGQGGNEDYREYVRKRLAVIAPVIEKVSLGEFTEKIQIPEGVEDEFTELLVGLNLMIDDLRFMFDENRMKTDELQRRLTELSIFNEIGRALGSTLQLSQLLEVIYTQTGRIMDTENFYIALYDEKSNVIDFPLFIDERKRLDLPGREAGSSLTGYIIRTRKPLLIKEEVVTTTRELGIDMVVEGAEPKCWLGVPMISHEEVVGVIAVQSTRESNVYDEDHQRLLEAIASQAASAVANARAYQELQKRVRELAAFNEVGRALGSTLKLEEQLKIIYEQARGVMPADHFYVALYHPADEEAGAELEFVFNIQDGAQAPPRIRPYANGLTEYIVRTREPLLIRLNLRDRIEELGLDVVVQGTPAKSWLGVPLIARNEVIGVMAAQSVDREEAYDEGDKEFLVSLASQASGAIDNARTYRELENRLTELSVLNEISKVISSTLDIEVLYSVVHEQINRLMNADNFYIALYDDQRKEVSFHYAIEHAQRRPTGKGEWATRQTGHGMTEYVIQSAKPQLVQGDSQVELARMGVNHIGKTSHSWIGAPMIARNEVIGVVAVQAFETQIRYSRKHMRLLQLIANQAAPAVENARAYAVLERRVTERTAELQKSNEALEDFVYTASHDLKAPLRAILGFSQFLVEDFGTRLSEEGKLYIDRMSASAKQMERLINDLLELSRVGRIKEPYEETDIEQLLSLTISTLAPDQKVSIRIEGPMPKIECERVRIGQVFANLISNSIKYNDKKHPAIIIGFEDSGDEVEFFVTDNGPGIEERHFEKIFKIFQRLSTDESGTGIGLALVKKIIEDHKGRIWVESEVGKGATFRFKLPKRQESS